MVIKHKIFSTKHTEPCMIKHKIFSTKYTEPCMIKSDICVLFTYKVFSTLVASTLLDPLVEPNALRQGSFQVVCTYRETGS